MDSLLSKAKTSRGRVSLRTVLRARLLHGFYYPFSPRPALRHLARLYCLCLTFTTTIIFLNGERESVYDYLVPIQQFDINLNVLMSFLTGDEYFFQICKIIEQVDAEMGFDHLSFITFPVQCLFVFLCCLSIITTPKVILDLRQSTNWAITISVAIVLSTRNLNGILNILAIDLVRHRLALLRHNLEINLKRARLGVIQLTEQIKTINNYLKNYKILIDSLNIRFIWAKLQITVGCICQFGISLIFGHMIITILKSGEFALGFTIEKVLKLIATSIPLCLPAIIAEVVTWEVEKIRVAIGNEILICDDEDLLVELKLAAEYLNLRPFKVTIGCVGTLDASLVLTFVGLCSSYLIMIIQITDTV